MERNEIKKTEENRTNERQENIKKNTYREKKDMS